MALEQVFLYVTQTCNIRCLTCYALDQLERADDLGFDDLLRILEQQRAAGAWKLSFLGGEPTVYRQLPEVIEAARAMGFRFIRITTNGMFAPALFDRRGMAGVDAWCFSLDGATAEVNDRIRRGGRFDRVIANMKDAVGRGFDVRVNVTVTRDNIDTLFDIFTMVEQIGVREVNLNVMFLMGDALDHDDLSVSPPRWLSVHDEILRRHKEFAIRIKLPAVFSTCADLSRHRAEGHRCLAVDGTRSYVASNGDVYRCLAMMDNRGLRSASFEGGKLTPSTMDLATDPSLHDYCHFIQMKTDGLRPLCIFHKQRLNA